MKRDHAVPGVGKFAPGAVEISDFELSDVPGAKIEVVPDLARVGAFRCARGGDGPLEPIGRRPQASFVSGDDRGECLGIEKHVEVGCLAVVLADDGIRPAIEIGIDVEELSLGAGLINGFHHEDHASLSLDHGAGAPPPPWVESLGRDIPSLTVSPRVKSTSFREFSTL